MPQIARDKQTKSFTPKGIRVAAKFSSPIAAGSVVTLHHHYLEVGSTEYDLNIKLLL